MKVSADLYNNYVYQPQYTELKVFLRNFADLLKLTKGGWTHNSYSNVPKALIKDAVYFDEIALKTESFQTEQAALTSLKLGINQKDGQILNASLGLKLNGSMIIKGNANGYKANHIPVLFALMPTPDNQYNIITGFVGQYDFRTNIFEGQIQYQDARNILWNV